MEILKQSNFQSLGEPWPDQFVRWLHPAADLPARLEAVIDAAEDERPIQEFLKENPVVLAQVLQGGHGRWVFHKPKLGSEHIPDFMLCEKDSGGYHWWVVEIENPNHKVLKQNGEPTAELTHALQQVSDWRIWLRKNCQYAQTQLGFVHLDAEFKGIVVVGRRSGLNQRYQERYRELSGEKVEVMSYDRLIDRITSAVEYSQRLLRINNDE